jgi:cytochrome P450
MANYTSAHRSPEFWSRPDEFYPEHFLDEDGKLIQDKVSSSSVAKSGSVITG